MSDEIRILVATSDDLLSEMLMDVTGAITEEISIHHCITASGTVRLASHYGPDVVFVDQRLAGHLSVAEQIRAEQPRTVIVLITSKDGKAALSDALASGARDYLSIRDIRRQTVERCMWSILATRAGILGDASLDGNDGLSQASAKSRLAGDVVL